MTATIMLARRILSLCVLVLCASEFAISGGPGPELQGFHAEYKLKYSIFSGDVLLDLRHADQPDEYIYETHTNARGAASLVLSGTAKETSRFRYVDGRIQSLHYHLNDGMEEKDSETDIRFDWEAGVAHTKYEGAETEYPINSATLDRISADMLAILELRAGRTPGAYDIADDDSIRTYEFQLLGEEQIKVPAGEFHTLKFKRQRPGSSRSTLIWYAPEANYLAVRIEQQKRGKTKVISTLTKLRFDQTNKD
jgi:hypothetical protein